MKLRAGISQISTVYYEKKGKLKKHVPGGLIFLLRCSIDLSWIVTCRENSFTELTNFYIKLILYIDWLVKLLIISVYDSPNKLNVRATYPKICGD